MSKYSILYMGKIDDNITTSTRMFSYGIIKELNKLDVELSLFNLNDYDNINDCIKDIKILKSFDFVLCHILDDDGLYLIYEELKKITKYCVSIFIEIPICQWKFDKYFLYMDSSIYKQYKDKYIVYNAPILKNLYTNIPKEKNSILLDHRWQKYLDTNLDISNEIIEWLKDISINYKIYKLIRYDEKQDVPDYIIPIYHTTFHDYLKMISNKEIFISTHAGSYNSTVIDMLAFGTKCLIPKIGNRVYIPQYNINLFDLSTFSNKEEMLYEISKPLDLDILSKQIDKCTDIEFIIEDIDKQFTKIINDKNE